MDSPKPSIPFSSTASKNTCTDLVPYVGRSNSADPATRWPNYPYKSWLLKLPDEILLMICAQVHDEGFGRSTLSKLSRTCRRAHDFVLPLLYNEIKTIAGCCRPIPGRYEARVPCSCSDEKRSKGFPRLDLELILRTLVSNSHLASLVHTVDLDQCKQSATGKSIFGCRRNDFLLPRFFLLPCVKFMKIPANHQWTRIAPSLETMWNRSGQPRQVEPRTLSFPSITTLHISNLRQHLGWDSVWSLISGCTNLEVLFVGRLRGGESDWLARHPVPFSPHTRVRNVTKIHLPNLVDLDIVSSKMNWHDLANLTQSCTQLRSVSLVQFQPNYRLSGECPPVDLSPGPVRILECLASSAATLEKLSICWAHKDFARTLAIRPDVMVLIKSMREFPALQLLELSHAEVEKGDEHVLVDLIRGCEKLESLKLIGITTMPRTELYNFAKYVSRGGFPNLRMLKLCTNMKDSQAWAGLKEVADDEIVSLLASGQVKLVLRPYHRKPGDPRFPELDFQGDNDDPTT